MGAAGQIGHQGAEKGGGEEEGMNSPFGNLRQPSPPWAPSVEHFEADGAPAARTPCSGLFAMSFQDHPLWDATAEDSLFQAGTGWLTNWDFRVTP